MSETLVDHFELSFPVKSIQLPISTYIVGKFGDYRVSGSVPDFHSIGNLQGISDGRKFTHPVRSYESIQDKFDNLSLPLFSESQTQAMTIYFTGDPSNNSGYSTYDDYASPNGYRSSEPITLNLLTAENHNEREFTFLPGRNFTQHRRHTLNTSATKLRALFLDGFNPLLLLCDPIPLNTVTFPSEVTLYNHETDLTPSPHIYDTDDQDLLRGRILMIALIDEVMKFRLPKSDYRNRPIIRNINPYTGLQFSSTELAQIVGTYNIYAARNNKSLILHFSTPSAIKKGVLINFSPEKLTLPMLDPETVNASDLIVRWTNTLKT